MPRLCVEALGSVGGGTVCVGSDFEFAVIVDSDVRHPAVALFVRLVWLWVVMLGEAAPTGALSKHFHHGFACDAVMH
jgi:hypothetical protein